MLADESAHTPALQQHCELQSLRCPVLCLALSCVVSRELTSSGVQPEPRVVAQSFRSGSLVVTASFLTNSPWWPWLAALSNAAQGMGLVL